MIDDLCDERCTNVIPLGPWSSMMVDKKGQKQEQKPGQDHKSSKTKSLVSIPFGITVHLSSQVEASS